MTLGSHPRGAAGGGAPSVQALLVAPEDRALLNVLPRSRWARNGVPSLDVMEDRERAAGLVREHLSDVSAPDGLRISVLGAAWSGDIELHITRAVPEERLRALGWLPLDGLLRRLGVPGARRWAVIEDGRLLTAVDLHRGPPTDPMQGIITRCRRRGEVRIREVLELRALVRAGRTPPSSDPVLRAAARMEAGLGGTLLGPWLRRAPQTPPVPLSGLNGLIARRSRLRRRRLVIAVTGVDGSGKSTVCRSLRRDLQRAGVPVSLVWTRPGMRIGGLDRVARVGKRLLGQGESAGVSRVAAGEGASLPSRRGLIGWVWALSITLAFLRDVRRRHRRGSGILVYDRHLADALVMLDVAYEGVGLRLHQALIGRLLPPAELTLYLDVAPAVAAARKPDDTFGEAFVARQLDRYRIRLRQVTGLHRLDASRPAEKVASEALGVILRGD
jgi:thymidylate kinase